MLSCCAVAGQPAPRPESGCLQIVHHVTLCIKHLMFVNFLVIITQFNSNEVEMGDKNMKSAAKLLP